MHSAELVLPSAARGEHLLQCRRTAAYLALAPGKTAEVVERSEHGGCQDAACAESAACRNGGEQGQLYSATESFELFAQCGVLFLGMLRQETGEGKGCLGY